MTKSMGKLSLGRRTTIRSNSAGLKSAWDTGNTCSILNKDHHQDNFYSMKHKKFLDFVWLEARACNTSRFCVVEPERPQSAPGRKHSQIFKMQKKDIQQPVTTRRNKQGPQQAAYNPSFSEKSQEKQKQMSLTKMALNFRDNGAKSCKQSNGHKANKFSLSKDRISSDHIARLKNEIYEALKLHRTVYEGEKQILSKLLRDVEIDQNQIDTTGFKSVMEQIGISISMEEARAFYAKHGQGQSLFPSSKLASILLNQQMKQKVDERRVRRGAFTIDREDEGFCGRIVYPQCRTSVYTPSEWNPELIQRSCSIPAAQLKLEFVYGYAGLDSTSQNIFFTAENHIAYYTAGIGIVLNLETNIQYFFLGHNDDIKSMANCPHDIKHNGVHYPEKALCATGQISSRQGGGYVCVWDSRPGSNFALTEIAQIQFEKDDRGVLALSFSPNGRELVCVTMDNSHSVHVYEWRTGVRLSVGKGCCGEPPKVYGSVWDPFMEPGSDRFLTFGNKHIRLWKHSDEGAAYHSTQLSFGKWEMQNAHSAVFLKPTEFEEVGVMVAGMATGDIYVFKDTQIMKSIPAHKTGKRITAPDGSIAFGGVRGLKLITERNALITGGADGVIRWWDVSGGAPLDTPIDERFLKHEMNPTNKEKDTQIKCLDWCSIKNSLIIGTSGCDIWRIGSGTQEIIIQGHSGDLYSLSWHPKTSNKFASVSNCSWLNVWDADKHEILVCGNMGFALRAVSISMAPLDGATCHHIATGGAKGRIKVVKEDNLSPIFETRDAKQDITDLKYSPDNSYLAVASGDTYIDIYSVSSGYSKVSRCAGHSSTVRHLDWSDDSKAIQSNCAAYEILYWNPKTGKQTNCSQRDTQWATWTCVLGFPVMGIWPEFSDGTDINACDRTQNGEFLATSGDDGLVKLFNYPCVVEDAPHRAYRGHSSHVMCVRFNADDSLLCSAGGKDRAVFQFKLVRIKPERVEETLPLTRWGPLDSKGKSFGWLPALPSSTACSRIERETPEHREESLQGSRLSKQCDSIQEIETDEDDDAGGWKSA